MSSDCLHYKTVTRLENNKIVENRKLKSSVECSKQFQLRKRWPGRGVTGKFIIIIITINAIST